MTTLVYIFIGLAVIFGLLYFLYKKRKAVKGKELEERVLLDSESGKFVKMDVFNGHRYFPESILDESKDKTIQELCVPNPKDKKEMDEILKKKPIYKKTDL